MNIKERESIEEDFKREHQKLLSVFDEMARSRGLTFSQERLEMMVDNALMLYTQDDDLIQQRYNIIQYVLKVDSVKKLEVIGSFTSSVLRN